MTLVIAPPCFKTAVVKPFFNSETKQTDKQKLDKLCLTIVLSQV